MESPAEKLAALHPRRNAVHQNKLKVKGAWNCQLRGLRLRHNLAMAVVAKAVGVALSTLQALEMGHDPLLTTAYKLSAFFNVNVKAIWPEFTTKEAE